MISLSVWLGLNAMSQTKVEELVSDVGCNSGLLDVSNDTSFRIEQVKVEDPIYLEDDNVPSTLHGTVFSERRQCGYVAAARRETSELSRGDDSI